MSAEEDAATRRIMNQFDVESRIPYLNIEEGDIGVLFATPLAGLFIAGIAGIESLAFPLVVIGLSCSVAFIYAAPAHVSTLRWTKDLWRYIRRPQTTFSVSNVANGSDSGDTEEGITRYAPFTPDEYTQDLTNIERAWPGVGAIERTDGAMEAFIEIQPGNMEFALADDWAQLQDVGETFANTELDFRLKFHATTRSFPVEHIVAKIEDRLTDEDVQQNPIFHELLEEYRDTRPEEMRDRGIQQVRYYIGVEVSPIDVYGRYRDEATPAEKLTQLPVIGLLFTPFVTRRQHFTEVEMRAQMVEKLDSRIRDIRTEFVQQAAGWSARRLSTVEIFVLNMDFWNGDEHDYDDAECIVREQPIIDHSRREDEPDA